jgi:hypothetical protein
MDRGFCWNLIQSAIDKYLLQRLLQVLGFYCLSYYLKFDALEVFVMKEW